MQDNMPEKSPQPFGSHLAGVPAPLCGFCVGPCEVVLLKKALPCLLCLLCLEEKGQRQQLKSHLIPENLS